MRDYFQNSGQVRISKYITRKIRTCPEFWALWVLLPMLYGCVESSYNPATQRQDYTLMSTDKEIAIGAKVAQQVEEELGLVADTAMQERVRRIGQSIASVCERQDVRYRFAVVDQEDVNAFSLPGGYVFVYRGLVERAQDDDELASVIAHEVAHVVAKHAARRYTSGIGMTLAQIATLAARDPQLAQGAGIAMQSAQLAYARDEEIEADRLAVRYLKASGYKPEAMLIFLRTMQEVQREEGGHYMPRGIIRPHYGRTHPFVPERLLAVKEAIYGVADYIDYLNVQD